MQNQKPGTRGHLTPLLSLTSGHPCHLLHPTPTPLLEHAPTFHPTLSTQTPNAEPTSSTFPQQRALTMISYVGERKHNSFFLHVFLKVIGRTCLFSGDKLTCGLTGSTASMTHTSQSQRRQAASHFLWLPLPPSVSESVRDRAHSRLASRGCQVTELGALGAVGRGGGRSLRACKHVL